MTYHVVFLSEAEEELDEAYRRKDTVTVLHIRHAARRRATEEDAGG